MILLIEATVGIAGWNMFETMGSNETLGFLFSD